MTELDSQWQPIDVWWNRYVEEQEDGLIELQNIIDELNSRWAASECLFDRDPLVEDWTETSPRAGPLRTNQEENWSQWLAHLVRSSGGDFSRELFGTQFGLGPERVRCERAYHDDELHDRRVDILAEFVDRGVSIEVKIGDEHYRKTPQTAYLTECHHRRNLDWTHTLLLPESKQASLQATFGARMDADGVRPRITATGPREVDVTVVYWQEVSRALRRTLLDDFEGSAHWEASAYLFVTLIEEKILRFYAYPSVKTYLASSLGISDISRIQSIDPEDQITYLTTVLEEAP